MSKVPPLNLSFMLLEARVVKIFMQLPRQDHRFIKRIIRPMLGFKSFRSTRATLAGIGLWRMLKKGQSKSSKYVGWF